MKEETWLPIPSSNGEYEASTLGRIRRVRTGKLMTQFNERDGYPCISFFGKRRTVHVLICETFHGPKPPEKQCVAHGDGNKYNNIPENLRWATYMENHLDKVVHGTQPMGENTYNSKLTEEDVSAIRRSHEQGEKIKPMARKYGVSQQAIQLLVRGVTWKHLLPKDKPAEEVDSKDTPSQTDSELLDWLENHLSYAMVYPDQFGTSVSLPNQGRGWKDGELRQAIRTAMVKESRQASTTSQKGGQES